MSDERPKLDKTSTLEVEALPQPVRGMLQRMSDPAPNGVPLSDVLAALERIAPRTLAADWDNVGLLVEPPGASSSIGTTYLTIDLTAEVLDEALAAEAQLIVTYHPLIFSGLKRLTSATSPAQTVMTIIQKGVYVYSPHTALDAALGGVNDWLIEALPIAARRAIEPATGDESAAGMGRVARLHAPLALEECVTRIKRHLGLDMVRLAASPQHRTGTPIHSIAVCAGAGGGVLVKEREADLWLTGEMRHHDVLAANARGVSVVLCDHTNTERGYLPTLATRLAREVAEAANSDVRFDVGIAAADRDPLAIV